MNVLETLIKDLNELPEELNILVGESIQRNKKSIISEIEGQLYQGEDAKGFSIRPKYAKATIRQKKLEGQPSDRVTLKDSGKNFEKMNIITDYEAQYSAVIGNTKYHRDLLDKYGDGEKEPFNLNEANLRRFAYKSVLPELTNFMRSRGFTRL